MPELQRSRFKRFNARWVVKHDLCGKKAMPGAGGRQKSPCFSPLPLRKGEELPAHRSQTPVGGCPQGLLMV